MTHTDASTEATKTFAGLSIAPAILDILTKKNFITPTPIQEKAIPDAVEGKDLIGIAQTGTGKTLAFGIPLVQHIHEHKSYGLILVPTRELAIQVDETLAPLARELGITTAVFIGGSPMNRQLAALRRDPHILICTPGRLQDHLDQGTVTLDMLSIFVLDEADRMLDMGFWPQVRKIMEHAPKEKQTMLFSATLSSDIMKLATEHMKMPLRIEVAPPGTTAEKVSQEFYIVGKQDKSRLMEKILTDYKGSTLVFTRTKHGARKLAILVRSMGHTAAEIHGDRSLGQRRDALEGFKKGQYRVLVATDIASRGIDVKGIELVLNFDLPMDSADYVHRIGRTARAGATGHAISFAEPHQRNELRDIERLIKKALKISQLPQELPKGRPMPASLPEREGRSFGRGGGRDSARGGYRGASKGGRPYARTPNTKSRVDSRGERRGAPGSSASPSRSFTSARPPASSPRKFAGRPQAARYDTNRGGGNRRPR